MRSEKHFAGTGMRVGLAAGHVCQRLVAAMSVSVTTLRRLGRPGASHVGGAYKSLSGDLMHAWGSSRLDDQDVVNHP